MGINYVLQLWPLLMNSSSEFIYKRNIQESPSPQTKEKEYFHFAHFTFNLLMADLDLKRPNRHQPRKKKNPISKTHTLTSEFVSQACHQTTTLLPNMSNIMLFHRTQRKQILFIQKNLHFLTSYLTKYLSIILTAPLYYNFDPFQYPVFTEWWEQKPGPVSPYIFSTVILYSHLIPQWYH